MFYTFTKGYPNCIRKNLKPKISRKSKISPFTNLTAQLVLRRVVKKRNE